MKPVYAIALAIGLAVQGQIAQAQDFQAALVAQLRNSGYEIIEVSTTLLGRFRIIAQGPEGWREIVINPRTGEVLRDALLINMADAGRQTIHSPVIGDRGSLWISGQDDSDGRDDSGDDDSDDEDDEDNDDGDDRNDDDD